MGSMGLEESSWKHVAGQVASLQVAKMPVAWQLLQSKLKKEVLGAGAEVTNEVCFQKGATVSACFSCFYNNPYIYIYIIILF